MRRPSVLLVQTFVICGCAALCILERGTAARGDFLDDREKPAKREPDAKSGLSPGASQAERYKLTLVKWTDKQVASVSPFGGGGTVYSVSLAPDGKHVLLGGDSGMPLSMLWNIETGEMDHYFDIFELQRDGSPVRVAVCPDGKNAALGTSLNKLFLVELAHGKVLHVVDRYAFVTDMKYSPDGKQLVLYEGTGDLIFLDAATGEETFRLTGSRIGGNEFCFSRDCKQLVSTSGDKTARIWNVAARKQVHLLQHPDWVWSVAFSPDGKLVATGTGGPVRGDPLNENYVHGRDNKIRLWDAATGKLLQTFSGHIDRIQGIQFVQGVKRLVSGSYDGSLRLWDPATGEELAKVQGKCAIFCVIVAGKDDTVIVGGGSTREGVKPQHPGSAWRHAPEERVRVFKIETVK
jgi:WD40 repeat protein